MKNTLVKSSGEWYFVHVLAGLTSLTAAVMLLTDLYMAVKNVKVVYFPEFARWILVIGGFAMLWFWIRMLVDFFRERPSRNPVMWGWGLVLGFVFVSLPYFIFVWRPRNRPDDSQSGVRQ